MKTEQVLVTPEMAEKWLEGRAPNRKIRENTAIRYAEDMDAGKWHESHEGLAFDDNGQLIDGQHRLLAITLAQKPVKFLVTRGLSRESLKTMNRGEKRTIADNITLGTGRTTSTAMAAAAHAILRMRNGSKANYGIDDVEEVLRKYDEGFSWAFTFISQKKPRSLAALHAIIIRCYYSPKVKRQRLEHVMEVLASGIAADPEEDFAIIKLRDYLTSKDAVSERNTLVGYFRIERAMRGCLAGEKITKMHLVTEEQFPLPGEPVVQPMHGRLFTEMKNRQNKMAAAVKAKKAKAAKKETL